MTDRRQLTLEAVLYSLALFLALFLRLFNLGQAPLSELESSWALKALDAARPGLEQAAQAGQASDPGYQPAYTLLTGAVFALAGATDTAARLLPALAGAALALLPLAYRRRIGRPAALVLAFWIAVNPGLVTVSRQAGGPMLALAFTLGCLAFWEARKPVLAGSSGGLALLSGPAAWFGLVAYASARGIYWLLSRRSRRPAAPAPEPSYRPVDMYDAGGRPPQGFSPDLPLPESGDIPAETEVESLDAPVSAPVGAPVPVARMPFALRQALVAGLIAFLLAGSLFMLQPGGLADAIYGLPEFILGWFEPSGVTPGQVLLTLVVYQPLALILAIVALVRWSAVLFRPGNARREEAATPGLWLLFSASLLLALLYPARTTADLVWALVPLLGAASIGLAAYLPGGRPNVVSLLQAGLVVILAALLWLWLTSSQYLTPANGVAGWAIRPIIVIGILSLGALTTALFALGWSWPIARNGLVWGLVVSFAIYSMAALWGAAQLQPNQPQETWSQPPGPGQARLFASSLRELSNWYQGMPVNIDVLSTVDTPSLRWALRDYPQARFAVGIPAGESPSLVITRNQEDFPALISSYRGQDFVWWVRPGWEGAAPPNIINWLAYRQAPVANEYIILWARNDLFPGAQEQGQFTP